MILSEANLRKKIRKMLSEGTLGTISPGKYYNPVGTGTGTSNKQSVSIDNLPPMTGKTDKFVFQSIPCSRAASAAKKEGSIWDSGNIYERDPKGLELIDKYWRFFGKSKDYWVNARGEGQMHHWSAIFVSWIMNHDDGGGAKWDKSARHSVYLDEKCWNRRKEVDSNPDAFKDQIVYLAFSGKEIIPGGKPSPRGGGELAGNDLLQPGDVIGGRKSDGIKIHMDVFVGDGKKVGGNTGGAGGRSYCPPGKRESSGLCGTSGLRSANLNRMTDVIKRVKILGSLETFAQENPGVAVDDDLSGVNVTNPVTVVGGGYPKENVRYVEAAMTKMGITNKYVRMGILCTIAKECNFIPKGERDYSGTDNSRIRSKFAKTRSMSDAELSALKSDPVKFFNYVYEVSREGKRKYGNRPGTNDGYNYRGRGFNQLTFRGSYEKYARLSGVDILNNPNLLDQPVVAAKVAVAFLANRLKSGHGTINPNATSYDEGIKMAAEANCKSPGANKDCSEAIASAKNRLKHFTYSSESGPGGTFV
jgi:predicted chitinase